MVTDWDDAYQNGAYISGAAEYPDMWATRAAAFRDRHPPETVAYGTHPREVYHLFRPDAAPRGLAVFVHGGYWRAFDHTFWSHLVAGPLAHGWAVAMPGYRLCPDVTISDITGAVLQAITDAAGRIDGPIHLAGHSAGGHLVARTGCDDILFPHVERLKRIVSISGVHDLRPLTRTGLNEDLRLDMAGAAAESPALKTPREGFGLTCWVGADERPEFRRQNALLADIWSGCFIDTKTVEADGHHHFSVIGDLADPESALTHALIDPHQGA